MLTVIRHLIVAASISLLASAAYLEPILTNQHVLTQFDSEPLSAGKLWRFDVHEGSKEFEQVFKVAEEHQLDIWQIRHSNIDIYTPSSILPEPLLNIQHSILSNISAPTPKFRPLNTEWDLTSLENSTFHLDYHPLSEIEDFVRQLKALRPELIQLKTVGHTGMGREMTSIVISRDNTPVQERGDESFKPHRHRQIPLEEKLSFLIIGAQHAREWIATATSLYLAHALVSDPSEPHSLSHLLDYYDFHIVPVPNPDGYDYTWEVDRLWQVQTTYKTRQQLSPRGECLGIDMNRNWGFKWKAVADQVSKPPPGYVEPCSHWFPGHRPFESPEVNNIANLATTIPNLVGFLDLRSYGQMLSSPFSYSCDNVPKDAEDQLEAGLGAARAMSLVHGTTMATGSLCSMLYRAPGNVIDWMYKRAGVKYSYALHLRDTGTYGFALPARWIRPVGEETTEMLKYLTKFIAKKLKREWVE